MKKSVNQFSLHVYHFSPLGRGICEPVGMATTLEAAEDGDLSRVKAIVEANPAAVNYSDKYNKASI